MADMMTERLLGAPPLRFVDEDDVASPPLSSTSATEAAFVERETSGVVRVALRSVGIGDTHGVGQTKDRALNSLDYTLFASAVNMASLRRLSPHFWSQLALLRWVYCILIGVVVALSATGIIYATKHLLELKFNVIIPLITFSDAGAGSFMRSYFLYVVISLGLSLAATLIVAFVEPLASGSGIPELKAYLNGINLPRFLRTKTLLTKIVALPLALASGLPVGYEGPMAHIGAATAAALTQGKTMLCGINIRFLTKAAPALLRFDDEKRDFACAGAAAGLAAAFNAPAGATLFVLEEAGAIHWHRGLLWRAFFTAVVSAYVIDFVLSGLETGTWGRLTASGMFTFGVSASNDAFAIWEVPLFAIIGVSGGLAGALFNALNMSLLRWRLANVMHSRFLRVSEVFLVTALVSSIAFMTPWFMGVCALLPNPASINDDAVTSGRLPVASPFLGTTADTSSLVRFNCRDGYFNDMASIWFASPENAIRALFHMPTGTFSSVQLFVFASLYLFSMCLASGTAVPSGVFIPSLLVGSAIGRLVGEIATSIFPTVIARAGAYAVVGAAAMLGGIFRMSISMSVILLETTGSSIFSLPIIVALIFARATGNLFNRGLYDAHIDIKHWPVLSEELHPSIAYSLRAADVMVAPPLVLNEVELVGAVHDTLLQSTHSGFPVVFRPSTSQRHPRLGSLAGFVQRRHLSVLLEKRVFNVALPESEDQSPVARPLSIRRPSLLSSYVTSSSAIETDNNNKKGAHESPPLETSINSSSSSKGALTVHSEHILDNDELTATFPRFPNVRCLEFCDAERSAYLDLRPYLDPTPTTIHMHAPLDKVHQIFTSLNLRHLTVVNDAHDVVGIITRHDLMQSRCEAILAAKRSEAAK